MGRQKNKHKYSLRCVFIAWILTVAAVSAVQGQSSSRGKIRLKTVDAGIFLGSAKRYRVQQGRETTRAEDEVPFSNDIPGAEVNRSFGGQTVTSHKTVYEFKGIPYAEAPVGNRRWQDPKPLLMEQWRAYDATKFKSKCPQWSKALKRVVGSEDCLYLNVYTPQLPAFPRRAFLPNEHTIQDTFYQERHLYPVLVHVHPGNLLGGSSSSTSPHKLLLHQDVLLVTFNYRLGLLGFLSSSEEPTGSFHSLPGNYGLLDQLAALDWVNRYISQFGGNPNRITVFGDVGYLLMSPLSGGLFSGAIWQTGFTSFLNPAAQEHPKDLLTSVCLKTGCCLHNNFTTPSSAPENKHGILQCLQNLSFKQLVYVQRDLLKFAHFPANNNIIAPVVDAETRDFPVLIDRPERLLEMGTLIKVPILLAVNAIEGHQLLWEFEEQCPNFKQDRRTLRRCLNDVLGSVFQVSEAKQEVLENAIWRFYFKGFPIESSQSQLLKLFGDLQSHVVFQKLLDKISRNSHSYAYVFTYEGDLNPMSLKNSSQNSHSDLWPWQDAFYLLGREQGDDDRNIDSQPNAKDYEEMMAKIWASFANYGTPKQAVTESTNWTRWLKLEPKTLKYYDLKLEPGSMKSNFKAETVKFWDETLREVEAETANNSRSKSTFRTTLIHIPTAVFWLIFLGVFSLVFCLSACLIYFCCLR